MIHYNHTACLTKPKAKVCKSRGQNQVSSVKGIQSWNSLPGVISWIQSLGNFRKFCKSFLFKSLYCQQLFLVSNHSPLPPCDRTWHLRPAMAFLSAPLSLLGSPAPLMSCFWPASLWCLWLLGEAAPRNWNSFFLGAFFPWQSTWVFSTP